MNRSLIIFVGVMAALLVALLIGIWWMGPKLTRLAFFDGKSDEPYVVVEFARVAKEDEERYQSRYLGPMTDLVVSEAGVSEPLYTVTHVMEGRRADEWTHLRRLLFPAAADLVQVMTGAPFRLIKQSLAAESVMQLGSYSVESSRWRDVIVVWLIAGAQSSDFMQPLLVAAAQGGGRVVWDAPVELFEPGQRQPWDRIVVVDFDATQQALAWLRAPQIETERAISVARTDELSLLVYERAVSERDEP